ncbi:MAG: MerR family transcriptional regulator [Desulfovibrio sp.]|jgi:DNA-binding transcriptional MerR regulator|nr:MerR family transcriptional regulator [Desulfovibrio sp.]
MSDSTLTHKELARRLGLSETTVKSYRRKFPGCFPVASKGKPIRFTGDALRVALRIQKLFREGMDVGEVQTRLAAEFDWIRADGAHGKEKEDAKGPELATGLAAMAKNLVSLGLEQKNILNRLGGLEKLLDGLDAGKIAAESGKKAAAALRREQILEERLNRLDENTTRLASGIKDLAARLESFIGRREAAAERKAEQSAQALSEAAEIIAEMGRAQQRRAQVVPLAGQTPSPAYPGATATIPDRIPSEPARNFFSLPLVVRTEEGRYISAGGRNRGRFSINDLKAMLIYGFSPPNHFNLHWDAYGQGWRLNLEQDNGNRRIQLLLMEKQTQQGSPVTEILELKNDGASLHPAEFCALIDELSSKGS